MSVYVLFFNFLANTHCLMGQLGRDQLLKCQNICVPGVTGKNPENQNFTLKDEKKWACDNQELALDKRFAGQ